MNTEIPETPETPEAPDSEGTAGVKKPRRAPARRPRGKKSAGNHEAQDAAPPAGEPEALAVQPVPEQQPEAGADKPADEPAKKPARKRKRSPAKKKPAQAELLPEIEAKIEAKIEPESKLESKPETVGPVAEPHAEAGAGMLADQPVKKPGRKRKRSSGKRKTGQAAPQPQPQPEAESEVKVEPESKPEAVEPVAEHQGEGGVAKPTDQPAKKPGRKRKRSSGKRKSGLATPQPEMVGKAEPDEELETESEEEGAPRSIKLLINAEEPEECRVALLENGKLESFHVETISREQHKGNIYKGRIVSIETNLQAAFVEIGTGKNGFLPFNEIHPEYYKKEVPPDSHWKGHKIKEVLSEGQEVLVEVVKDVTGNKGASLTTYLSLPGRYVVLMPGSDSHGISKKIDKEEERQKLREMLAACNIPEGVGYIIRTASDGITKTALTNDVKYQLKLWSEIKAKALSEPTPSLLYKEQSIIDRFLRDHFSSEIGEILVDSQEAYDQVTNFLALLPATQRKKTTVRLHKGPRPLLNSYNIEEQIEQIFRPTVKLPSGGSIVINPTEALVSIDVNSGSTGRDKNFEDTIFLANMEAAEELARQLRLRDLGGLIVVDFIDMRPMSHIKEVEKKVKTSMKRDKAKVDFTRISKFGLMEISRQRMGAPIQTGNYQPCEYCQGHGMVRSVETQALAFLRQIQTGVPRRSVTTVHCHLPMEVGNYLLNKKRADLTEMEREHRVCIVIETEANLKPSEAKIEFIKER